MKIQVLLPKVFNFTFTYCHDQTQDFKVGDIVEVPFGSKNELGVIWNGASTKNKKIKIKNIKKGIDNYCLDKKLIKFIGLSFLLVESQTDLHHSDIPFLSEVRR